jgi:hypothetical protein
MLSGGLTLDDFREISARSRSQFFIRKLQNVENTALSRADERTCLKIAV